VGDSPTTGDQPANQPNDFFVRLAEAEATLKGHSSHLPPAPHIPLAANAAAILNEAARRLSADDPYGHPLYAGQMLKPPHPIARAAYALAMSLNPNNHALDGGRASSAMEVEAVAALAAMFQWPQHLGHLTSGGTVANLEALWVAAQLSRESGQPLAIAASDQAHYTHRRMATVLGLPFVSIPSGNTGSMDIHALKSALEAGNIGTVVATLGTTATGAVDALDQIAALQARFAFRLHVDAAYGGYFTLAQNLREESRAAFDAIHTADSIVIDPHKHGLQPYGCGAVLFRDPAVGRFYKHDSPYTYFTSSDLHLGEISLECSRAGASAVALWATQQLLPCTPGGEFAHGLESGRDAALDLHHRLRTNPHFIVPATPPQLDIVVWTARASTASGSSAIARAIFQAARERHLYLALADLPTHFFPHGTWRGDDQQVTCLRSVLIKPEHKQWIAQIDDRLNAATEHVLQTRMGGNTA
jgi:tyrosine decarboxylase/aspartate 1-decarboxylase